MCTHENEVAHAAIRGHRIPCIWSYTVGDLTGTLATEASGALCGSGAPREWRSALALSQLSNPFPLISVSASGFFTEADKRSHLWILQAYGKAHRESTYAQNTHLGQEVARTEKSGGTYHLPPSHPLHALSRVLSHLTGL